MDADTDCVIGNAHEQTGTVYEFDHYFLRQKCTVPFSILENKSDYFDPRSNHCKISMIQPNDGELLVGMKDCHGEGEYFVYMFKFGKWIDIMTDLKMKFPGHRFFHRYQTVYFRYNDKELDVDGLKQLIELGWDTYNLSKQFGQIKRKAERLERENERLKGTIRTAIKRLAGTRKTVRHPAIGSIRRMLEETLKGL